MSPRRRVCHETCIKHVFYIEDIASIELQWFTDIFGLSERYSPWKGFIPGTPGVCAITPEASAPEKREKHKKRWICLVKLDGFRLTLLETLASSKVTFEASQPHSFTNKNMTFLLYLPVFAIEKNHSKSYHIFPPQWFTPMIQPPGLECRTEISSVDQGSCQRYGARCLSLCRFPEVQHCHIFMGEEYQVLVA